MVDRDDFGCYTVDDENEVDPNTECNDGIDNDLDGWIDVTIPCVSIRVRDLKMMVSNRMETSAMMVPIMISMASQILMIQISLAAYDANVAFLRYSYMTY